MKRIKYSLWGLLTGLTVIWALANLPLPDDPSFITIRNLLVQYSGVIAISMMSVAMTLAARPRWLEPVLGGLDKSYRLHKWLGISALVLSLVHWLGANGPRWMVQAGLLEKGSRSPSPDPETLSTVQQLLVEQRDIAEFLGEWAFYGAVIIIVLALVKRIPYQWFAKTHRWIAGLYLVLVFHSLVLIKYESWTQPINWIVALLMLVGSVTAIQLLTRQAGARRCVTGEVESLEYFPGLEVLQTRVKLNKGWNGHRAGQFAFVTYDQAEGAHPFTISSAWNPGASSVVFTTKALGDYTARLPKLLTRGTEVEIEGPYGCFTFDDPHLRQIWVAGGIGITPFLARLDQLSQSPHEQVIDLVHTTAKLDPELNERLSRRAKAANVRLHILVDGKDGLLNGERLRKLVPEWMSASIWFCGPVTFGKNLRSSLLAEGLPVEDFHQELFEMR